MGFLSRLCLGEKARLRLRVPRPTPTVGVLKGRSVSGTTPHHKKHVKISKKQAKTLLTLPTPWTLPSLHRLPTSRPFAPVPTRKRKAIATPTRPRHELCTVGGCGIMRNMHLK
eukprot:scaffold33624_cov64-Attheya_sp.AAC.1